MANPFFALLGKVFRDFISKVHYLDLICRTSCYSYVDLVHFGCVTSTAAVVLLIILSLSFVDCGRENLL